MNKLIAIGLVVLLGSASAAGAKTKIYTLSFDGLCDTMTLTLNKATATYGSFHLAGCPAGNRMAPASNPIPGVGIVVKRPPGTSARYMMLGETVPDDLGAPVGYMYVIDYPFVTGGAWLVYSTQDGKAVGELGSGTYTVQ
jgi:hypothetical protein